MQLVVCLISAVAGGTVLPAVPGQQGGAESQGKGLKMRQSRPPTDTDSRSKKSSRQGTASNSISGETPKRAQSGWVTC